MESCTWVPIWRRSSVDTAPLMAATVPTFMKTGVCMVPWTVFISARFAFPSLARILYSIGDYASFFFLITYHMAPVRHTEE